MDMNLFDVRSAAIVGASPKEGKAGNIILKNFKNRFKGKLFAVNPNYSEVLGIKCYPSVKDIPEEVDLVVVSVPAKCVPDIIKDSVEKNVKLAVIISAGFSETGEEGRKLEEKILEYIKDSGLRVIGPNGMGLYDPYSGVDTFFVEESRVPRPPRGSIAVISQSGAIALALMEWLALHDIGVSKIISYGNKIDLDEVDVLKLLEEDENTKIVFIYMEGLKPGRGREFVKLCKEMDKPIVVLKAGKSKRGKLAVSSHTASMAGDYEVYLNAFRQCGLIEARNMEDLLIYLKTLSYYY